MKILQNTDDGTWNNKHRIHRIDDGTCEDTYNDISSMGVDFLRNLYASSGLSIRPKTEINKIEMLKAFVETLGLDPYEILSREAMSKPHRTIINNTQREELEIEILSKVIKQNIIKEITDDVESRARGMVARERFEPDPPWRYLPFCSPFFINPSRSIGFA